MNRAFYVGIKKSLLSKTMGLGVLLNLIFVSVLDTALAQNIFLQNKVQIQLSNLQNQRDQDQKGFFVKEQGLQAFSKASSANIVLPQGTRLVSFVDNLCVQQKAEILSQQPSLSLASVQGHQETNLSLQAYNYELRREMSLSELESLSQADPCLIGLVEDVEIEITGLNNDPRFKDQHALKSIQAQSGHDLFWRSSFRIRDDVVIAIVDTGVDYRHEDLKNRMWKNSRGEFGFNYVSGNADPWDDNGHGTHCAGLAAAESSNQIGISGVMGFRAQIMAVKAMDGEGSGSLADVANAIRYSAENGADIINLSLGARTQNSGLQAASQFAVQQGSLVLAAAGNNNQQITSSNFFSPAGYALNIAGMLSIGSVDALSGNRSSFSNFSNTYVQLMAPGSAGGQHILSTWPQDRYQSVSGTSMATPIAAGAAGLVIGLLKSNGLDASPATVEKILLAGASKKNSLDSTVKDGNALDMQILTEHLRKAYLFDGTGGFEGDF